MKGFKKRQIKGETALMDVAGSDWNFTTQNLVNRDKKKGETSTFNFLPNLYTEKNRYERRCVTFRYRSLHMKSRMCPRSVLASPLQLVGLAKRSCWETAWSCSGRTMKTWPSWSSFSPAAHTHMTGMMKTDRRYPHGWKQPPGKNWRAAGWKEDKKETNLYRTALLPVLLWYHRFPETHIWWEGSH